MVEVLVTNDDGVDAKGIRALAKALREVKGVHVTVVAPDREQSTTSHSLTLHRPLRIRKKSKDVYAVNGTPTDSVYLGTSVLFKDRVPDLVFSGINRGGNLGDDIHYSGTVSAAMEGALMGIPSVAVSQLGMEKFNYKLAADFSKKLLKFLIKNPLDKGLVLNVNVPAKAKNLSYRVTKTGKRDYGNLCDRKLDPRGRPYYWIGGDQYKFFDIAGSDCNAIVDNKISITPIKVNLTETAYIKKMKSWKI